MYFGLLLLKSEAGIAKSEKRVAAIFLLPVWPLQLSRRSFLPYSGLYCRHIGRRRLEMLSVRKPGATNINLWTVCTIQKAEVLSKVPEMVRNVKLTVIRKTRVKSRPGQTSSGLAKPEVLVYFGVHLIKSEVGVAESEKRVAAILLLLVLPLEPLGRCFFCLILVCIVAVYIAHKRLKMLSIRKPRACTKSKSVARKYNLETGSTFKSARNVVKLTVIRKTLVKSCRGET